MLNTRKTGKKEQWEIDKAGEKYKLEPLESDVHTEAIEPGRVQTRGMLNRKNEDKEESFPVANPYPSPDLEIILTFLGTWTT